MSNVIKNDIKPKIPYSNKLTDYLYANISVGNSGSSNIRAEYSSTQNLPLIGQQEDFEMRVVRFKVPMASVPLFVFRPGRYYVGFGLGVDADAPSLITDLTTAVEVRHTAMHGPDPQMPTPYQDGIYSIKDFLRDVNRAIREAWLEINPGADVYPYIKLDECCKIFELVMPIFREVGGNHYESLFYPVDSTGYRLLMSPALYALFEGFCAYKWPFHTGVVAVDGTARPELVYGIQVNSISAKDIFAPPVVPKATPPFANEGEPAQFYNDDEQRADFFHCYKQNQSSIYAWLQASRIIITSSMSVVREAILAPDDDNRPERLELLTDFIIEQDNDNSHREYVYYNDTGNERYMNLKDEGPLRRIDMKMFIEFEQGILVPLYIMPGNECSIKLGFRRKWNNDLYQVSDPDRHTKGP